MFINIPKHHVVTYIHLIMDNKLKLMLINIQLTNPIMCFVSLLAANSLIPALSYFCT